MWLDQTEFRGFKRVDYRFEYSDSIILCHVPDGVARPRLTTLCERIDEALTRIVKDLRPCTTVQ